VAGLAALVILLVVCSAARAAAADPIEAVWAFNGGEVAIVHEPNGSFAGIVDEQTTFATCPHTVGEQMWTEMRPQPDGSYWGLHQWFFESVGCQRNPTLGPTAWRVMTATNGSRYLLVCFSQPGTSQPTIAPNGATAGVTYRCYESALLAALPLGSAPSSASGRDAFAAAVGLPNPHACLSHRVFQIHLHNPPFDPIKLAVVLVRGHRVAVDRRGKHFSATIDLRGLPKGRSTVKVMITTVLGHHLSGTRVYHTCIAKRAHRATHVSAAPRGGR
jgi:hypothetical protein